METQGDALLSIYNYQNKPIAKKTNMIKNATLSKYCCSKKYLPGWLPALLIFFLLPLTTFSANLSGKKSKDHIMNDILVQGTIKDSNNEVLSGVIIRVKGSKVGTTTNVEGRFSITVAEDAVLEISYLGFKKQEVGVKGRKLIDIMLEIASSTLDEVVVLGYGTISKSDFTGSSSSVKLDKANENRIISAPEALQGRIAGVQILNNTGEPGSGMTFNIRGTTSITGSNQPLIVIDGQPIESDLGSATAGITGDGGNAIPPSDPLASINPSDIASIEVLKDASSIAIYGSRGANGVVLITTKSGQSGKKVAYSTRFDVSMLPKQIDMLSSLEYMQFRNEAVTNGGAAPEFSQKQLDSIQLSPNTNWQDLVYRNALSQDHQISFSGREQKSNFLITANYAEANGIILNSDYTRGGVRLNYETQISPKLTVGLRTYFSLANRDFAQQSNGTGILGSSAVMGALSFNPLNVPYQKDNLGNDTEEFDVSVQNNPLLVLTKLKDKTLIKTLLSNFKLDYKLTKDLSYQFRAGVNDLNSLRRLFEPTGTFRGDQVNRRATYSENSNSNYLIDNLLSYKKVIANKHSINAVGGYSYQKWNNKGNSVSATDFPTNDLDFNAFKLASSPGNFLNFNQTRSLASVLGRVNYAFDKRYLFTLTGRYDGASRLSAGNRWQLFPSIGLGWNVSNEKFFEGIEFISLLKFRGSYGIAGNENISVGATQAKYTIDYGTIGSGILPSYIMDDIANPDVTWEKTKQLNIGFDFGFLNNRASLSVDAYKKNTTDLLINLPLPISSGLRNYSTNVGEVVNRGIDVEGTYNLSIGKVRIDAGANFSVFDNNVLSMGENGVIYGRSYLSGGAVALNQAVQVAKVGNPISSFWGYKTAGVYQDAAQVAAGPEKGVAKPGQVIFVDTNNDGQITDADKTIIGNPSADFTYGFNASMSYKRLSFSFNLFGSQGNQLINMNKWVTGINYASGNQNTGYNQWQESYDNRWTGPGTSNLYPAPINNADGPRLKSRFPDWMVEDASFLRLQNVQLGYTIKLPKRLKVGDLKTFVSGTNIFTITPYKGYDPNINAFGHQSLASGTDFGTLPQARTVSAGLELTF